MTTHRMLPRAPGPVGRPIVGNALEFRRDPLAFFTRVAREHCDVAEIRLGPDRMLVLSRPEDIEDVFVTRPECFRKSKIIRVLGGYIFGLPLKERLLALEHATPLLVGCTSTRILCVHGCAHERRIRPDRRVVFASIADARSVGYRSCARCGARVAAGLSTPSRKSATRPT